MAAISSSSLKGRPASKLGWWAVSLAGVFLALFILNSIVLMPVAQILGEGWWNTAFAIYGIFTFLCGFVGGVLGLVAILRHERSGLVWITILPLLVVVFFLVGEFFIPPTH
jgi:peptidoglycan/LPS O-acetylase OafA/YrhL